MKQKPKPIRIKCPYCGRSAVLRNASYVHKEKALEEYMYVCSGYPQCDSYVGVHAGTKIPRGILADRNLRRKRTQAHRLFDAIKTIIDSLRRERLMGVPFLLLRQP